MVVGVVVVIVSRCKRTTFIHCQQWSHQWSGGEREEGEVALGIVVEGNCQRLE